MGVCHLASKVQAGRHLTINARSIDEAGSMLGCHWIKLKSSPYWWYFQKVMTHTQSFMGHLMVKCFTNGMTHVGGQPKYVIKSMSNHVISKSDSSTQIIVHISFFYSPTCFKKFLLWNMKGEYWKINWQFCIIKMKRNCSCQALRKHYKIP